MKKLRRVVSLLLLAAAFGGVSACTPITAWDDDEECLGDRPGSNTFTCDD